MEQPELESLLRVFGALAPLPAAEAAHLCRGATLLALPRGTQLLREGEPVDWLGFLASGLVRIFRRAGEREVTLGFDCEARLVGAFDAFVTRAPARYGLETLEPSCLVRFERAWLEGLEARHPCWRELFRRIAERELVHKIDKELRIRTRTPEQRYAELVRAGSFLVRRVPQYHLASFLGIAPETLSRIRARMDASQAEPTPARRGSRSVSRPRS
jgi:CRP-like cAMP-binding protein